MSPGEDTPHHLLILSRHAADYLRLIEAARLPRLAVTAAADPAGVHAGAADAVDCALGDPSLLRHLVARLANLRWVQATWAGVEPLLDPSLPRTYTLTNVRGVFGPLVTEYVFGYLLAHERRIIERFASQQAGKWDATPPGTLRGRRLGLLGVGSIGSEIARTAKHFGMEVRGYTRTSEACPHVDRYYHGDDRFAFANDLDYLIAMVPNTARTRHLVDAALLRALPDRCVLVNPARGSVVDEAALASALERGALAGAVLDVFQEEPLPPDHAFWRTPNVLLTGHTAALSAPGDIAPLFIDNYRRMLRGEPLCHRVDFEQEY